MEIKYYHQPSLTRVSHYHNLDDYLIIYSYLLIGAANSVPLFNDDVIIYGLC